MIAIRRYKVSLDSLSLLIELRRADIDGQRCCRAADDDVMKMTTMLRHDVV